MPIVNLLHTFAILGEGISKTYQNLLYHSLAIQLDLFKIIKDAIVHF